MTNLPAPAEDAALAKLLARQLDALQALTELGMGVAQAISADAQAPAGVPRRLTGDLVLMFTRISRA